MAKCYNKVYLKEKNIWVNCGKCLNCIAEKQKEIANRFIKEIDNAGLWRRYFITLTYDPLHAEYNKNNETVLNKKHLKSYIEKLQYQVKKSNRIDGEVAMKYVSCGEYGAKTERAHYHLVVATNRYIDRTIKFAWKYGHVKVEKVKNIKAIFYTTGYTAKKVGYNDKKFKDKEVAFVKFSRGLGKSYIDKLIAMTNEKHYYLDNMQGKTRLPIYFKNKIKQHIMGVVPKYHKLNELEQALWKEQFNETRKTIMINQDEYDKNYYKWDKFINKVKIDNQQRDSVYNMTAQMMKKWLKPQDANRLVYDLMYNENYEPENRIDILFKDYYNSINNKLKCEAENKYWKKLNNRIAV